MPHHKQWRWYTPRDEDPPAKKEFLQLPPHGQAALQVAMKRYATGDLRRGMIKSIDDGLLELRVQVGTDPFRVLFFLDSPVHAIVVRVFYKNTKKLPKSERKIAEDRMKLWKDADKR